MARRPSPLAPHLTALSTSTTLLSSTLDTLSTATADLPRLTKVLGQTRHFELAPSSALAAAQAAVLSELAPEVERLLSRVEKVVQQRERREEWLRARWALGEGRLGRESGSAGADGGVGSAGRQGAMSGGIPRRNESTVASARAGAQTTGGAVDAARAQRMRQKRERLSYAVERLQLQAGQRERQLRKSMAMQDAGGGGNGESAKMGQGRAEKEEAEAEDDF